VRKGASKIKTGHLSTHAPHTKNQSTQHCVIVDNAVLEGTLGILAEIRNVDVSCVGHKIVSNVVHDAELTSHLQNRPFWGRFCFSKPGERANLFALRQNSKDGVPRRRDETGSRKISAEIYT
jgi:hypothetical protein